MLARSIYDGLLQRVLPALLCAAIVYPMAGLSASTAAGPPHAALFLLGLCLVNLVGSAVISCAPFPSARPLD